VGWWRVSGWVSGWVGCVHTAQCGGAQTENVAVPQGFHDMEECVVGLIIELRVAAHACSVPARMQAHTHS